MKRKRESEQNFIDRKTGLCKIESENGMGDERGHSRRKKGGEEAGS
jgi:hypothetical protein